MNDIKDETDVDNLDRIGDIAALVARKQSR